MAALYAANTTTGHADDEFRRCLFVFRNYFDIKLTTVQWASERETADMQHEGHRILQQQNMSASRDRDARIILLP